MGIAAALTVGACLPETVDSGGLTLDVHADLTRIRSLEPRPNTLERTVVHAEAAGGMEPYTFRWTVQNPMGQRQDALLDDLSSSDPTFTAGELVGPYLLTCATMDAWGATLTGSVIIYVSQDLALSLTVDRQWVPSGGGPNGQVLVAANLSGGTPPYRWTWNAWGPDGQKHDERLAGDVDLYRVFTSGEVSGTYRMVCSVLDASDASVTQSIEVLVEDELSMDAFVDTQVVTPGGGDSGRTRLNADVSGGRAPFTYAWTITGPDGAEGNWLDDATLARPWFTSPAQPGTYRGSCTVTDARGQQAIDSVLILVSRQLSVSILTDRQRVSAGGGENGEAMLSTTVVGGTSPYQYHWTVLDPAGADASALMDDVTVATPKFTSEDTAGTYRFTCEVTDAVRQTALDALEITVGQQLVGEVTVTSPRAGEHGTVDSSSEWVSSGGGANGQATITAEAIGGTPPYAYTWVVTGPDGQRADERLTGSAGNTRFFYSSSVLGTYRVTCTITDATGVTFNDSVKIAVYDHLQLDATIDRFQMPAAGGPDGTAHLRTTVSGGTPPFTYAWTINSPDGGTENSRLDNPALPDPTFTSGVFNGIYQAVCVVTDSVGQQVDDSLLFMVGQTVNLDVTSDRTDVIAAGGQALLTAQVRGGIPPYEYAWQVTNPLGIEENQRLDSVSVRTPVFTSALTIGTYTFTCTVTDSAGFTAILSVSLVVGGGLDQGLSVDVSSNRQILPAAGEQAALSAAVLGGVEPIAYEWEVEGPDGLVTGTTLDDATIPGPTFTAPLTRGTYVISCTVTDTVLKHFTDSISLYVGTPLSLDLTTTRVALPATGESANLSAIPIGGIAPYTYTWTVLDPSNGNAAATLSDTAISDPTFTAPASAGTYRLQCTVADSDGATYTRSLEIYVGMSLSLAVTSTKASLPAAQTCALSASARGGVSPYTYAWTVLDPVGGNAAAALSSSAVSNPTFTAPATAGTYRLTCTITDAAASTFAASLQIDVGMSLSLAVTGTKTSLPSAQTCTLSASARGGISPYTYAWTVLDPSGGNAAATLNNAAIAGPTFTAPAGAGTYRLTCTVTDAAAATFAASLAIEVGMPLSLDVATNKIAIPATGGQAALTATANGGTSPYTYAWTALDPSNGNAAATLSSTVILNPTFTAPATAGTYRLHCTVTDAAGVTFADSLEVYVGMGLSLAVTSTKTSLPSAQTCTLSASARGGVSPYTYAWTVLDPSGGNAAAALSNAAILNPTFTAPAGAGTYRLTCTVTDAAAATFAASLHIEVGMPLSLDVVTNKIAIPATGGQAALTATVNGGTSAYTYAWTALDPSGGNAAAALSSTAVSNPTFTAPATAGTYRLKCTATDAAGTTCADSLEIYVGMGLSLAVASTKTSLPSAQTCTLSASARGGISAYSYAWTVLDPSGGNAAAALNNAAIAGPTFTAPAGAGTYRLTCTVTDAAAATFAVSLHIEVGMPLSLDVVTNKIAIPATGGQAALTATANGGTSPYTYAWTALDPSNGNAAATLSNAAISNPTFTAPAIAGTYRLHCTVTDAAGTTCAGSVQTCVGAGLSLRVTTNKQSLITGQTAALLATAQGGIAAYTYAWTVLEASGADETVATLNDATVLNPTFTAPAGAGTYRASCTVTDTQNATFTSTIHMQVGMALSLDVTADRQSLPVGGNTAVLTSVARGGLAPYTYAWTATSPGGGDAAPSLSNTAVAAPTFTAPAGVGTYRFTCVVTDATMATFQDSTAVDVGMDLAADITVDTQSLPVGQTATISVAATGGEPGYTYAWSVLDPVGGDAIASLDDPAIAGPIFTAPATPGTYRATCTVTDTVNATVVVSTNIQVGQPLSVDVSTTRLSLPVAGDLCTLNAAALGGSASYTYAWSVLDEADGDATASLDDPAIAGPTFTAPAAPGTYRMRCTVTDTAGATSVDSLAVLVGMPLSLDVTATEAAIAVGWTTTLQASTRGGAAPYTLVWSALNSAGGDASGSLSSTSAAAPVFTGPAPGTYRLTCTVTDDDGVICADSALIQVGLPLSLVVTAVQDTLATADTTVVTAAPSGGVPAYTYAWNVLSPTSADVTATVLSSSTAQNPTFTAPYTGGTYRLVCTATDARGATCASALHLVVTTRSFVITAPAPADSDLTPVSVLGETDFDALSILIEPNYVGSYARTLKVRLTDPDGNMDDGNYVTIDGVGADGHFQTETFRFDNPSTTGTTLPGVRPFITVELVHYLRIQTGSSSPNGDETISIGVGNTFGLPEILFSAASVRRVVTLPNTLMATPADYSVITTPGRQGVNFTNAANDPDGAISYEIYYDDN